MRRIAIALGLVLIAACDEALPPTAAPSAPTASVVTDIANAPSRSVLLSHLHEMDDLLAGIDDRTPLVRDCRPQRSDAWVLKFNGDAGRPAFLLWVDVAKNHATATHWRMQSKVREISEDEAKALHGGRVRVDLDPQRTRRYFLQDLALTEPRHLSMPADGWREATQALYEPALLALPPVMLRADGYPRMLPDGLALTLEACIQGQYHLVHRPDGLPESRWFDDAAAAMLRVTAAPEPMLRAQLQEMDQEESGE